MSRPEQSTRRKLLDDACPVAAKPTVQSQNLRTALIEALLVVETYPEHAEPIKQMLGFANGMIARMKK